MPQVLHGKSPQAAANSSGSPASDVYAHLQAPLSDTQSPGNSTPQPAATKPIIQLQSVTKTYPNGSRGLLGVNLEVKRGSFLFVTGPSGSGKTTFLKLLYGAERPNQGDVVVDDYNLSKLRGDRLSLLRRRIGIVFQDYKLIPRRTVAENVAFVLQAQGYTRKEIQRRLQPTLRMVGLQDKADCFPDELSGGEQQRVSIARAVVSTPPLLLADEPTGNLDSENSWQVIKILKKLNGIGITVIVTTHDEQLVRMSNHPVVQIKNGRLSSVKS
ncbi:cell division ATP-binding protein FtsE [Trichocoleus desertorum AS-A10]|uniref:cell division ATP-binding protein FtsE n=1 Tax=Trichocoleus desertorum TaxID=1481672 RepID=UPI0032987C77